MIIAKRTLACFIGAGCLLLAGCAREVPLHPAENANDPHCADVIVRLPDEIAGQQKHPTNAQATSAWGDPTSIVLHCGTPVQGPTTDRCVNVNGVDWVIDESKAPKYRFIAYGRNPGLELLIDSEHVSGTDAVTALTRSVSLLPQERHCSSLSDTQDQQPQPPAQVSQQ